MLTTEQVLKGLLRKSVCVVGNAPEILDYDHGAKIDEHDIVIRMNAGVPEIGKNQRALGTKTTILTVGTLPLLQKTREAGCKPKQLWWMKRTKTGRVELAAWRAEHGDANLWDWPQDMEDRVTERVGAPPTSGIRVLDLLQNYVRPKKLSVTGVNWFGSMGGDAGSWWKKRVDVTDKPAIAHCGRMERQAFEMMGLAQPGPQWWTVEW